jgi:putative salt-induced outer membrane protein
VTGLGTDAALCAVLSMAGAVALSAQAKPEKPVSFTGDVGIVNTAGNTSLTTLSVGDKLTIRSGKVLLTQTFALVYGKSEGVENANNQLLRGRADYQLASRLSGYGFIGYERNRFAGISHRTDEGVGLALAAARGPSDELDLEGGVGLVQETLLPDPAVDVTVSGSYASGRAAARYKHLFTKVTYFQQTLEFLADLEATTKYRVNSESALVAPISSHLALKAGYLVKFNHAPPSPDLAKTDRTLTTGLQITY